MSNSRSPHILAKYCLTTSRTAAGCWGAPFNVAWHFAGLRPVAAHGQPGRQGRTGRAGARGDDRLGMSTRHLQTDPARPTGQVTVTFEDGEPAYDIVADCAYDNIDPVPAEPCELLYHGSLAARAATSAATLKLLRAAGPRRVFIDVNLRPPWWQPAVVQDLLAGADWVKLNSDELAILSGNPATTETGRAFSSTMVCAACWSRRAPGGRNCCWRTGKACRWRPGPAPRWWIPWAPATPSPR